MSVQTETVLPPPEISLIDYLEAPGYSTNLAASPVFVRRGGILGNPLPPLLDSVSGPAIAQRGGVLQARMTSAANTVKSVSTTRFVVPLGLNLAAVPSAGRSPQRHRLSYIVERTAALVADVPLSLGWGYAFAPGALSGAFGFAGYELFSEAGLNGGRWTVRNRSLDGGSLDVIQDTGISAVGICSIEIGYDSDTNPRCFARVNGTEFGVVQGIGNVPSNTTGNVFMMWLAQGLAASTGAAQQDWFRQGRYRVTELPGFET